MTVRALILCAVVTLGLGCSSARLEAGGKGHPAITLPARMADGERGDAGAAVGESTRGEPPSEAGAPAHALPDPEPLRTPLQWQYSFRYRDGAPSVENVKLRRFEQPVVTARQIGRFAVELWIGKELVDRVRFDFPLLGAEPPPAGKRRPLDEPPSLAAGADVTRQVLVPASERATRAVLVDRATGRTLKLPWPPDAPLAPIQPSPE